MWDGISIILICGVFKVLLFPAYRSTDFEVHRNWLAITHTKPYQEWYTDAASKSEWTLDYPPLFAWFEWALSQVAQYIDPAMLDVENLGYASPGTVAFQRSSVLATELVLMAAVWQATKELRSERRLLALFLVAAHPGLLIVDHIHFQYNGMLLGIFILSISLLSQGRDYAGAAVFAVLLCFKHIFLYTAPAFFVYLLRHICRPPHALRGFLTLGIIVTSIFLLSFGPFLAAGQLPNLLQRLFPVARGLTHAYWAPNAWALYALTDKALSVAAPQLIQNKATATLTGGLVGIAEFQVLPQISSRTTAICALATMLPALIATWHDARPARFARCAVYCTLSAFMFGYHVHEKAILMVLLPMAVLAVTSIGSNTSSTSSTEEGMELREYILLNTIGVYSLFPLLFTPQEYPVKVLALAAYTLIATAWFAATCKKPKHAFSSHSKKKDNAVTFSDLLTPLSLIEKLYLGCMVPVEVAATAVLPWTLGDRLPFLPLMVISGYCAVGVMYCWLRMAGRYAKKVLVLLLTKRQRGSSSQNSKKQQ